MYMCVRFVFVVYSFVVYDRLGYLKKKKKSCRTYMKSFIVKVLPGRPHTVAGLTLVEQLVSDKPDQLCGKAQFVLPTLWSW